MLSSEHNDPIPTDMRVVTITSVPGISSRDTAEPFCTIYSRGSRTFDGFLDSFPPYIHMVFTAKCIIPALTYGGRNF